MTGVSIVIKCLNEEKKIDEAIRSALAAAAELGPLPLEVVVADGLSTDHTIARATRWAKSAPVRVVQLLRKEDRGCGAGVELGFIRSRGDRVLFMDGDMTLLPGFLGRAMRYLDEHPDCAGVAGLMSEATVINGTDRIRTRQGLNSRAGDQPWLNGGGLYRREALQSAGGYAGDPRLAAYEEADLGLRLQRAGWRLHRLDEPSMQHAGHAMPTWKVLMSRWRGRRYEAAGRLLKLHGSKPNGSRAWRLLAHPVSLIAVWLLLAVLVPVAWMMQATAPIQWASAGVAAVLLLQIAIKRDLSHILTSWVDWHLLMAGIMLGCLRPMRRRHARIDHRVLADGTASALAGRLDHARPRHLKVAAA